MHRRCKLDIHIGLDICIGGVVENFNDTVRYLLHCELFCIYIKIWYCAILKYDEYFKLHKQYNIIIAYVHLLT